MKIGDFEKVFLPGESPWAEVLEIDHDMFRGRIANTLFHDYPEDAKRAFLDERFDAAELPQLHDFHEGDEVWFRKLDGCWQPVILQ